MVMRNSVDDFPDDDIDLLSLPVTLPNGVTVPNRLAKVSDSRVRCNVFIFMIWSPSTISANA